MGEKRARRSVLQSLARRDWLLLVERILGERRRAEAQYRHEYPARSRAKESFSRRACKAWRQGSARSDNFGRGWTRMKHGFVFLKSVTIRVNLWRKIYGRSDNQLHRRFALRCDPWSFAIEDFDRRADR